MTLRLVTVVGTRPEFVQVGTIARAIKGRYSHVIDHLLVHTGQHYDANMSEAFFDQLGLPDPARHLGVGSGSPSAQIGAMMIGLDDALRELSPDLVVVFGDTNSTLAGALAAVKLGIPVAHIESGLRSFNLAMPEETNRVVTDHVSSILFCPSTTAMTNLNNEGITDGIYLTGDVMYEATMHTMSLATNDIFTRLGIRPGGYAFATTHRSENTDDPERLNQILLGMSDVASSGLEVVFPVHPRTAARMEPHLIHAGVKVIEPLSHLEALTLVESAALVMTDSGGLQKETYWLDTPCMTMREETEWIETVTNGWNILAGADRKQIAKAAQLMISGELPTRTPLYGEGTDVSGAILEVLLAADRTLSEFEAS